MPSMSDDNRYADDTVERQRDALDREDDEAEQRRLWQDDDVEFDRVLELWRSL